MNKPSHLTDFAALIGSKKGTHPIAPDQYISFQDKRFGPYKRLWSLLQEHTSAPGHRKRHATIAGKPMTLQQCAGILKLDGSSVRKAWREMQRDGRAFQDPDGYLCLAGEFKLAPAAGYGEEKEKEVCTNLFPPRYMNQINKLAKDVREDLERDELRDRALRKISFGDLKAANDFIFDQRQNSRLAGVGVKLARQRHKARKGEEQANISRQHRLVQLWPVVERFVQTLDGEGNGKFVQTATDFVQTLASAPETTATPHPAKPSTTALPMQSEYRERSLNKREASGRVEEPARPPAALSENGNGTDPRHHAIREALSRTLCAKLQEAPPDRIVSAVLDSLGTASIESLEKRIMTRIDGIRSYGIVPALAADVAAAAAEPVASMPMASERAKTRAEKFAEEYNARKSAT